MERIEIRRTSFSFSFHFRLYEDRQVLDIHCSKLLVFGGILYISKERKRKRFHRIVSNKRVSGSAPVLLRVARPNDDIIAIDYLYEHNRVCMFIILTARQSI